MLFNLFARVEHRETFYWLTEPLVNMLVVFMQKALVIRDCLQNGNARNLLCSQVVHEVKTKIVPALINYIYFFRKVKGDFFYVCL